MRLIDADALMEEVNIEIREYMLTEKGMRSLIRNAPTIDAVEVVRGEWIPCTKSGLPLTEMMRREGQKWYGYRCSNCSHIHKGNALIECNFCPNCGAKMKGASDE